MAMTSTQVAPARVGVRRNGAGTAALVTGSVALVLAVLLIFFPIAGLLGIVAAILGGIGLGRANRGEADNKNHAVAGLALGLLSIGLAAMLGVRFGTFINEHQSDFRAFWTCITSAPTEAQQNACGEDLARTLDGKSLLD